MNFNWLVEVALKRSFGKNGRSGRNRALDKSAAGDYNAPQYDNVMRGKSIHLSAVQRAPGLVKRGGQQLENTPWSSRLNRS